MYPVAFPECNSSFGPPPDLDASQCLTVPAYIGRIAGGSLDGAQVVVTAWKPTPEELAALNNGGSVFLTVVGGLPPHMLSADFQAATTLK